MSSTTHTRWRGLAVGSALLAAAGVLVMIWGLSGWTGLSAAQATLSSPTSLPPAEKLYTIRVQDVTVVTPFGVAAELPSTVTTLNADGSYESRPVRWSPVFAGTLVSPGIHTISGTLLADGQPVTGHIRVFEPGHTVSVAAIGDSITMGYGLPNETEDCYPAQLGALLGDRFSVSGYGASGTTALTRGNAPYVNDPLYAESLQADSDVVLLQLGTNDSKAENWRYGYELVADYRALIDAYRSLPSAPTVYVVLPPAVQSSGIYGITDVGVNLVIREILAAVSTDAFSDVTIIDNNAPTRHAPQYFTDAVHPNLAGAQLLAEIAQEHITGSGVRH
ncbi:hypothetical protein GCM10022198_13120 [Klugiella xanthotipulae]|uniref:Lysophospholipase L1-like esterase n=1 Tax=Klugiella xanthotipulae TaxID=244735 RepID=A0A543I4A9_9MICO|nr:GDSL-type esterase/lipase family protein [Klugiella xanthotipulae]TQM65397.1 lysophospholipase L1-like esterase [Klugiella xanthotipulae]